MRCLRMLLCLGAFGLITVGCQCRRVAQSHPAALGPEVATQPGWTVVTAGENL